MKITISIAGRFHAFDLAAQMHKRGHLHRLITTYPYFKVAEWGIPRELVVSIVPIEVLRRLKSKAGLGVRGNAILNRLFDHAASRFIPKDTDLFIGWSGCSLRSIMRAKELGAKTILERGSAHIERQKEILEEEFRRAGVTMSGGLWDSVGTELQEYALADRIEVPSTFASTSFEEKGFSSEKIIRSGLGVNLEHFRPVPKKDDVFRVIFVGQLSLRKGATYLLRVAQEVKRTLPIEFWHVGAISSDFKMLLKEYVPNVIEYKGKVPQKELAYYYSQSNVFLMPSVEEGFGMVQVQAMACGLPLICTTNTGGGDLIAEGVEGFVVPIRDAKAVREKVLFLYNNPEICREMGRAARLRVESGFTWDDYGDLVEKKYSQFLNETCKA